MNRYNDNQKRGNYSNSRNTKPQQNFAQEFMNTYRLSRDWIVKGASKEMVDYAEKVGESLQKGGLTTSKIRNVYGEIKRIQMLGFENAKSSFYLLKPKMAYALGRDEKNEGLQLFKKIFDECFTLVNDEKTYKNFCNFMEAILAYHKSFGGKE